MRKNKLLLLLALLMTAATGAWAQDAKHLITATHDKTRSLEQPLPYATTIGELYEAVTGEPFSDLINRMSLFDKTLTGISSTKTDVVSIGELNGASTPVTVKADGEATVIMNFSGYNQAIFVNVVPPLYAYVKDGVKDDYKWTVKVGEGQAQALPIGGLKGDGSETVTLQYNGRLKVKGVKATSDAAPAAPAFAANEYNEASWDGTKVVFTKKTAASDPTAVANSDADVTWSAGWYTVSGNVTITGNVKLTADAHLILQDGATLTINGQLNCRTNSKNLYIYGQKKGDGKLIVTNNSDKAINSNRDLYIDIHGGEVTAAAAGDYSYGIYTGHLAVYGGKLTATSNSSHGINFQNTIDVYGGEVVATSNATSSAFYGFRSSAGMDNQILTVYGGKVTATGNGVSGMADYGSGFGCHVKSGTSGIKFYFSADGTTWGDGTSYASVTKVGADDATKKRYAKAE